MKVAANIGNGTQVLEDGGAHAAALRLGDSTPVWKLDMRQSSNWPADARGGNEAQAFSGRESFRSGWQSLLHASSAVFGLSGETEDISAGNQDAVQTTSTTKILADPRGTDAIFRAAGKAAGQNGTSADAVVMPAIDKLQNAASGTSVSGWVLSQPVVDRNSHTVSAKAGLTSGEVHGDRNASGDKRVRYIGKPERKAQDASVKIGSGKGANLPAVVQAPVAIATQSPAVKADLHDAPRGREFDGSLDLVCRSESGLETHAGPWPSASSERTGPAAISTTAAAGERMHSIPQAPHASGAAPVPAEPRESGSSQAPDAIDAVLRAPGIGPLSEPSPSPQSVGEVSNEGQRDSVQGLDRAASETTASKGTRAPDQGASVHIGDGENAGRAPELSNVAPESDRSSLSSGRLAIEDKSMPGSPATGASEANSPQKRRLVAHPIEVRMDRPAWEHIPSGTHSVVNTVVGSGVRTSDPQVAAAKETFAELDLETAAGAPRWIHAAGRQIEAGFEDPALGWVGVKADLSGGSVHAVLMPGTAEAAQVLGAQMAGLSAHLAEQHTQVSTLTLATSDMTSGHTGAGENMQQGAGQNTDSGGSAHTQWSAQVGTATGSDISRERTGGNDDEREAIMIPGGTRAAHISVMA